MRSFGTEMSLISCEIGLERLYFLFARCCSVRAWTRVRDDLAPNVHDHAPCWAVTAASCPASRRRSMRAKVIPSNDPRRAAVPKPREPGVHGPSFHVSEGRGMRSRTRSSERGCISNSSAQAFRIRMASARRVQRDVPRSVRAGRESAAARCQPFALASPSSARWNSSRTVPATAIASSDSTSAVHGMASSIQT